MSIATDKAKIIFGNNLTYWLNRKGKQQVDLALELGITKGAVSQWCNGKKAPSAETAKKVADYLGIKLSDLTDERQPLTDDNLKFALFGGDGEITDAQLNEVKKFAQYIKERDKNDK